MLQEKKVTFIGSGVMGQAMIAGLIEHDLIAPQNVIASDPIKSLGERLNEQYGVGHSTDNVAASQGADIVILAVKPQYLDPVLAELGGKLPSETLILSIVAGVPIDKISRHLKLETIVRVMPNTPARVGKGMSVWTATDAVNEAQREQVKAILGALGQEIFVEHEYFLDMATALCGSGPAYVFLFIEALIDAGVHMGFSRPIAQELVLQTVEGSVAFARAYPSHPAELRNMVTSPGGTTADALYQLEKGGMRAILSKAVFAAYQKSKALGSSES